MKGQPRHYIHGHQRRQDAQKRFWVKADRTSKTGCWPWKARLDRLGYGGFSFKGRLTGAHRASYEINNGPIPDGMHVLHRCDNRSCVRPSHLFLGTHRDNMADMKAKGRAKAGAYDRALSSTKGENHPMAKLSEASVRAIHARMSAGESAQALADEFGVSSAHVCLIAKGKAWRHLGLPRV